jgi:hypothetical protein
MGSLSYGARTAGCAIVLLMTIAARAAHADSLTLSWDPSVDANATGYLVYIGVQSGVYTQAYDSGHLTSFTYASAVPGQRYYFAVAAYADASTIGIRSEEVSAITNAAPTLANPGSRTATVGQLTSLQLVGSDPDGTALTFSATGLPPGLILTASTGYISGTPTTGGTYTVTARVSDGVLTGSTTFTWTVTGVSAAAPTSISPSGSIATATPTFVWNPATGATSYVLSVDDSKTLNKVRATVSAAAAGCTTTSTACRFAPGVALAPGAGRWAVQSVTSTGAGAWSAALAFTVPDLVDPAVAIAAPIARGTYETTQPSVNVSGVASDNGVLTTVVWASSNGRSGTAVGTSNWTAAIPLQPGNNTVTFTARDAVGNATSASLTVVYVVAPTALTPALSSMATPTFMWTAAPAATKYVLSVSDSTQANKILVTVTAAQAGCDVATTCAFSPGVVLASGSARWRVDAIALTDLGAWSAPVDFVVDSTAPSLKVTSPTRSFNYSTTSEVVTLSGTAADDIAVVRVSWFDNLGRSGVATGTSQWMTEPIALEAGTTTFTVSAVDGAGNMMTTALNVTYVTTTSVKGKNGRTR